MDRRVAGCGRGDHCFDTTLLEPAAQAVGVIGLVRDQPAQWSTAFEQEDGHGNIGDVARCQREGDRLALIIGQAVDFRSPTASRAVDGFLPLPLFEPAAERCAFTWVLSRESSSGIAPAAAIFSNSRRQTPCADQRLKRL